MKNRKKEPKWIRDLAAKLGPHTCDDACRVQCSSCARITCKYTSADGECGQCFKKWLVGSGLDVMASAKEAQINDYIQEMVMGARELQGLVSKEESEND